MTFLCIITWLFGLAAFLGQEPALRIKARGPSTTAIIRTATRWQSARYIARLLLGATLMVASMFVAALNAGLL